MPNEPDIGARLGLDISEYDRNIRQAIRDAAAADRALDSLVDSANDAEKALNAIDGDIEVAVNADLSSLLEADRLAAGLDRTAAIDLSVDDSSILYADRLLDDLDRSLTPLVDVQEGDLLAAKALLDDFNASVSVSLDVEESELEKAAALLEQLDAAAPVVPLTVTDADITVAQQKIEALDSESVSVTVSADDSEVQSVADLLADIDSAAPTVSIDADTSEVDAAIALINDLEASATVKINADDSELNGLKRKIEDLDAEVDVAISADDSVLDDIRSQLADLRALAVIDLVFNLAGSIPSPADVPILGAIIEADAAARNIAANLGGLATPENMAVYSQGATDLYTNNFGESQQEAADFYLETVRATANEMGTAATTGEDFTSVAIAGLTAATVAGEDFNEVLRAADNLVETGLADSYTEAFDAITTGFQVGLNQGGDFLDTINEYSVQFEDLGFTTEQWFSLLHQGMDAGQFNTDFLADLIKEANIRAQAALTGEGVEFDALSALGVVDEAEAMEAGEITGQQYIEALFASIQTGLAEGTITPQTVFDALGTRAEDMTIEGVLELDPAQVDEAFATAEGATGEAGEELFGSLEAGVEEARRLIETELADALSDALDVPGIIADLNEAVRTFSTEIREGATIPQAIEVALDIPGFAEGFARVESAIGNLGIAIMQAFAGLLQATGQTEAAASVQATIANAAATQLAFDLQLADDAQGVQNAVTTAINRGVDASVLGEQTQLAGTEMLAAGDLEGVATLVASLQELETVSVPDNVTAFLAGEGIDPTDFESATAALSQLAETAGNLDFSGRGLDRATLLDAIASYDAANVASEAVAPLRDALIAEINTLTESGDLVGALELAQMIDTSNLSDDLSDIASALGVEDVAGGLVADIEAQMETAFAELDLSGANLGDLLEGFDLATALGDDLNTEAISSVLQETFAAALESGDFDVASQIAETLNIEELNTQLATAAAEANVQLDSISASSDEMGASVGAGADAAATGISALSNAATTSLPPASDIVGDMAARLGDLNANAAKLDEGTGKLTGFAGSAIRLQEGVGPAQSANDAISSLATNTIGNLQAATQEVDNFIYALMQINNLQLSVPSVSLPPVPNAGSNLYGGVVPPGQVSTVHGGETLVQAPNAEGIAVLNQADSNAIYSALAQLMAAGVGGGGGGNVSNTYTYNVVVNAQGASASTAAMDSAMQARGY